MKSKTSFFSSGIFIDDLKRFGWISAAYLILLFFIVPLQIMMQYSSDRLYKDLFENLFHFRSPELQGLLIITIPVFTAIFLFRYIQVKISSDMIHSLPIKRTTLYITHTILGVIVLILPVVIIAAICIAMQKSLHLGQYYRIMDVIQWCGTTILMDMVFFFSCAFVGMIVGISVMQGALTYIFLFLPVGLMVLLTFNLNVFLYGFGYNLDNGMEKLSPMVRVLSGFNGNNKGMEIGEISVYIILCVILFFSAIYIYNKRNLEAATQPIAFKSIQYAFKYGATFCMMLTMGVYFQQTQKKVSWILFGYIIGSLIGYFVAEMILRKSIWVFNNFRGYLAYCAVIIVIFAGINVDIFGYEKKQPALDNVNKVYFSEGYYNEKFEKYNFDIYQDKSNIKSIYDFHKALIDDKSNNKYKDDRYLRNIILSYYMNDGSKIQRSYKISYDDYKKYLKPIYESAEYKKSRYDMLSADAADIEKITISGNFGSRKQSSIVKPEDIKEALEILKKDAYNEKFEEMDINKAPWGDISFMIANDKISKYPKLREKEFYGNDKQLHSTWNKSYVLFEEWLTKKGYIKNARVMPEDIEYVVVERVNSPQEMEEKLKTGQYISNKNVKRLEIKDKKQIEICLRNYGYVNNNRNEKYVIGFYNKNKECMEYGSFNENYAPDFVKSYFSK